MGSNGNMKDVRDFGICCGGSYLFSLTTTTTYVSDDYGIDLFGEIVGWSVE